MSTWRKHITRGDWAALAVCALFPGLVFWQGLVRPADVISEDAASYFQPYYAFAADEVQAGRLPLWNPFSLLGLPYHAALQGSLFYPLRWPAFWMDYVPAFVFLLWSHFSLTAVAGYLLLRIAIGVGPLGALLGALSIAFGGFTMGHISHLPYFLAYPWFLGCLLFVWLAVRRAAWRWTIGAGGCVGLLGLIGAVHLLLILGVLLATYVVYHTIVAVIQLFRRRERWTGVIRPGATVAAAVALGGLIAAVQLLPARALSQSSVRQAATWQFINMACAHPVRNTLQLVVPFYFGNSRLGYWSEYNYHDMAHYTGVLVLLAAAVGVVTLGRDRHLWFLVILAIVGFLVGAGKYLPVYRVLYDWVPAFDQLRNPTRIFWCTDIALACLAAIGIDRTLGPLADAKPRHRLRIAAIATSGVVFVILASALGLLYKHARDPDPLAHWVDTNPNVFNDQWKPLHLQAARNVPRRIVQEFDLPSWGHVLAALAAIGALPILVWRGRPIRLLTAGGLVAILGLDLFALSFATVQYEYLYRATVGTTPRAKWLQDNLGLQRYLVLKKSDYPTPDDDIVRNQGMLLRARAVHGVGGGILDNPLRAQFCHWVEQTPALMNLAGVRFVYAEFPIDHPQLRLVSQDERYRIYENAACQPMAFFVRHLVQVVDPDRLAQALLAPDINLRETAFVSQTPPPETANSTAQNARVANVQAVPGRWEIEADTDAPAQLVVTEGYDRGWRCQINKQSAPILQTNGQFMSVAVSAGRTRVVLE